MLRDDLFKIQDIKAIFTSWRITLDYVQTQLANKTSDWNQKFQNGARHCSLDTHEISLLIYHFRFVLKECFFSPENNVANVFYLCLSSCSSGIFCLLVALYWGEFNNLVIRNDIKPPMAADKTYNQISWERLIFATFCIVAFTKLKDASLDTTHLYHVWTIFSVLPLAERSSTIFHLLPVRRGSRQWTYNVRQFG